MTKALSVLFFVFVGIALIVFMRFPSLANGESLLKQSDDLVNEKPEGYPSAILAGGCFWCTESEFRALNGVLYTRVGYMGGHVDNVTYQQITTGQTGHAEVIEVTYDPEQISYRALLEFFFTKAHDPTQLNRQGVDVGTQYRSAIFYQNKEEKQIAQSTIDDLNNQKIFKKPIVTTLETASTFWEGEEYHQQYYEKYEDSRGYPHIRVLLKKQNKG